jgi:hypothetical protein
MCHHSPPLSRREYLEKEMREITKLLDSLDSPDDPAGQDRNYRDYLSQQVIQIRAELDRIAAPLPRQAFGMKLGHS